MASDEGKTDIPEVTTPESERDHKECARCGRCCRVLALKIPNITGSMSLFLVARGAYRDGEKWIIPSVCPHLVEDAPTLDKVMDGKAVTACDMYEQRPILCRVGPQHPVTYMPKGCTFRED